MANLTLKTMEKRIAARLLAAKAIDDTELERALADYDGSVALQDLLVSKGLVTSQAACRANAEVNGMKFITLDEVACSDSAIGLLTPAEAWRLGILPIAKEVTAVTVAVSDPSNVLSLDELKIRAKVPVAALLAEKEDLENALERYYGLRSDALGHHRPETHGDVVVSNPSTSFSDMNTRVDVPVGDAEASNPHAEYQRKLRRLRESSSSGVPRSFSEEKTRIDEATNESLAQVESRRVERRSYDEAPLPYDLQTRVEATPAPFVTQVSTLLEEGIQRKAEELELNPLAKEMQVRYRIKGAWEEQDAYDLHWHMDVVNRLLTMAGIPDLEPTEPLDHRFLLRTKKGEFLSYLFIQPTEFGPRIVVRFLDSLPLLNDPLETVGVKGPLLTKIRARLMESGGGLLFVTAPDLRGLNLLYDSMMRTMAQGARRDVLSLERPPHRRLPGVTSINCPTEDILLASIANSAFMNPDVIGVSFVESGTVMNRLVDVAMRGTAVVACYTAATMNAGAECFRAAKLDAMNFIRGTIGHLHVHEASKLCPDCAQPIGEEVELPQWAEDLDREALRMRGEGCKSCKGTGFRGTTFLIDFEVPQIDNEELTFNRVINREVALQELAAVGSVDPTRFRI